MFAETRHQREYLTKNYHNSRKRDRRLPLYDFVPKTTTFLLIRDKKLPSVKTARFTWVKRKSDCPTPHINGLKMQSGPYFFLKKQSGPPPPFPPRRRPPPSPAACRRWTGTAAAAASPRRCRGPVVRERASSRTTFGTQVAVVREMGTGWRRAF